MMIGLCEVGAMVRVYRHMMLPDFPLVDTAYAVCRAQDGRYCFCWGPIYPYASSLPDEDVMDDDGGIQWFWSRWDALGAMWSAVRATGLRPAQVLEYR